MNSCPECGSDKLVYSQDDGELTCSACGLVVAECAQPPLQSFVGRGGGVTFEHLADKNLTTDFNPFDVKNPDLAQKYMRLRALNRTAPIRRRQGSICAAGQRVRPLLEGTQLSPEVVKRAATILASKVAKTEMLRIHNIYDALAVYSITRTDKRRLLLMGIGKIVERVTGSKLGRPTVYNDVLRFSPAKKCFVGRLDLAGETVTDCIVECQAIGVNAEEDQVNITTTTNLNECTKGRTIYKSTKRKGSLVLTVVTRRNGRCGISLEAKILRGDKVLGPQEVTFKLEAKRGARYDGAWRAYQALCTSFNEDVIPLMPEDFVERDEDLDAGMRQRVVEMAKKIRSAWLAGGYYQTISWCEATAVASQRLTSKSLKRVARKYDLEEGTLKQKSHMVAKRLSL